MNEEIKKACQVMREGGVILYPTDTIWGIGCDATNEEAVRRVYEIKRRADSKAMLVLVDSAVKVDFYVPTSWLKTAVWASASRARNFPNACASSSARPSCRPQPM